MIVGRIVVEMDVNLGAGHRGEGGAERGLGTMDLAAYGADSAGIWFRGGLRSTIPVVLASDGKVIVWHDNNYQGSSDVPELSVFAESVSLMGPEAPYTATLRHPQRSANALQNGSSRTRRSALAVRISSRLASIRFLLSSMSLARLSIVSDVMPGRNASFGAESCFSLARAIRSSSSRILRRITFSR